jgi:hypothetical protein
MWKEADTDYLIIGLLSDYRLGKLRENHIKLGHDYRQPGRDINRVLSEHLY